LLANRHRGQSAYKVDNLTEILKAANRISLGLSLVLLVIAAVVAGWLLGGRGRDKRKAMAFSTGARNVSVSLVIVTASFPGTPAVTAVLAYALLQTALLALLAAAWGRWAR